MNASRVEASFGLSPMQLGMLFHHLSAAHSGVDLEQIVCTLREEVDARALRAAWRFAAERHAALRVAFRWAGLPEPVQDVHAGLELPFREEDWSDVSDAEKGRRFETFLADLPTIGSICSGGRYDNLAGLFTKQELPGIGASLGLDRLLAALEELGMLSKVRTPAPVLIAFFDKDRLDNYLRLAATLREAGIGVEVFPEPKKLGQQLQYADRRGFRTK